jgi:hypothetical protein
LTEAAASGTDTLAITGIAGSGINGGASLANFEQIRVSGGGTTTFLGAQLTGLTITINEAATATNGIVVTATGGGTTNLSGLLFTAFAAVPADGVAADAFDGGADTFVITGADGSAETITGPSVASSISGGTGADVIVGGAGVDTLVGGGGVDVITGNAGNDVFQQGAAASGLLTAGAGATTTTALDIFNVAAGDIIQLLGSVDTLATYDTLTTIAETGNLSNTVTAGNVQVTRGIYVGGTTNTFTVATVAAGANAVMINYDDNAAGTAAAQSIVLVGVTALTAMTDGVITV